MTPQPVPYAPLDRQWAYERESLLPLIDSTLASGEWVGASRVNILQDELAKVCQQKHAVCLNSGTDALVIGLTLSGVKPGDEVITVPNSFIATAAAIVHVGAIPVFVDVLDDQTIDVDEVRQAISARTRAVLPVHLTGRMCDMDKLVAIADDFGVAIVEDAAQAVGSKFDSKPSGAWGTVGCFSLHPLKNLNAVGDGGFIVTDDRAVAERATTLRSHGLVDRETVEEFGFVSRMDAVQASVALFRLRNLSWVIERRRKRARIYREGLEGLPLLLPPEDDVRFDTFHTFVIQTPERERLKAYLELRGIQTRIHYPKLITDQPAMQKREHRVSGPLTNARRQSSEILSLPINQHLSKSEIRIVIRNIRDFFEA
jgi:dTDP-4-amino-4,6-dideoxygalactose transaminase